MHFRRLCRRRSSLADSPCPASIASLTGQPLLVVETGVGRAAVEAALEWVVGRAAPRFALFSGFAGALHPELGIGDLLLADAIVTSDGEARPTTWPGPSAVLPQDLRRGRLLTSSSLIATANDKRRLRSAHEALAVDMEAAPAAAICARHGIPFGCLRVISDRMDTSLSPALVGLLAGASVSPLRLAAAVVRRPSLASDLWRLARDTRFASRRLAEGLRRVLTQQLAPCETVEIRQDGSSGQNQ